MWELDAGRKPDAGRELDSGQPAIERDSEVR